MSQEQCDSNVDNNDGTYIPHNCNTFMHVFIAHTRRRKKTREERTG